MLTNNIIFVLVKPKYSGNVGFVARVLKNFGFKRLVLISPLAAIDDEARKLSVHAKDILQSARIYESLSEFIEKESVDYLLGTTARIGGEKNPLRLSVPTNLLRMLEIPEGAKIGILFGNEESGLTNEELSYCDLVLTIPTSGEYPTMNLSHAVAIVAYELALALNTVRELPYRPATRVERQILERNLINILEIVAEKMPEGKKEIYRGILKNWVRRAFLSGREIHSLIGFSKLILKSLKSKKDR